MKRIDPAYFFNNPATVALIKSAMREDRAGVNRALSAGANPNDIGRDEISPLLFVLAYSRRFRGVNLLLDAGADPNYVPEHGPNAMAVAVQYRDPSLLRSFLDHGGDPELFAGVRNLLSTAALAGQFGNVAILVEHGADIDAPLEGDCTLLMGRIAGLRDWEHATELLEMGADPRATDRRGRTVADYVAKWRPSGDYDPKGHFAKFVAAMAERGVEIPPLPTEK